jgi:hypothetical protein
MAETLPARSVLIAVSRAASINVPCITVWAGSAMTSACRTSAALAPPCETHHPRGRFPETRGRGCSPASPPISMLEPRRPPCRNGSAPRSASRPLACAAPVPLPGRGPPQPRSRPRSAPWSRARSAAGCSRAPDRRGLPPGLCIGIKGRNLRFEICQCRLVGDGHRIGLQIGDLGVQASISPAAVPPRREVSGRHRDDLRLWP